MKPTNHQSCSSTSCPNTSDFVDESLMQLQSGSREPTSYVPAPSCAVPGPASSIVVGQCPRASLSDVAAASEYASKVVASDFSTGIVSANDCTLVESVFTGQSVVPPPETVSARPPECAKWAGAAFGEAVAQEVPVPLVQEQLVYRPVKQIVRRPVEKTTFVPKVIKKEVAEFRQIVTDEVIEVPKPYPVETRVYVPNYKDHKKPCVIAQKYIPVTSIGNDVDVECVIYEPEVRIVNVKVPKIIGGFMQVKERHTRYLAVENVSKAQWNTLIFKLNPDLCSVGDLNNLPVHRGPDGSVIAFKTDVPVGVALD